MYFVEETDLISALFSLTINIALTIIIVYLVSNYKESKLKLRLSITKSFMVCCMAVLFSYYLILIFDNLIFKNY